ncbi:hypothetical protein Clacol_000995 [Clathrus columnatus]|uniref:Uncharacterized protein n=1 Tax=Clathrus columnatus TaxID=1419009 RepID=A0AAV5A0J6_9AGAM|nr:hypothetical protein Clacol_000995 [Clathrus columnatus]
MGGFIITDQERNPVQVLVLHPSHLRARYFKDLLPTITKVDDHIKAYLKILLTDSFETYVTAHSTDNDPREFPDVDSVVDETIPILMMVIFKTVSESELLQLVLSHKSAIQSLAVNMAREAVKITFPIIMEKCKDEISENLTWETFEDKLCGRLEGRLRAGLPGRLQGIRKTLEPDIQGRSRQDSLAKTFALAQITWFVAQCITRKAQHPSLPLTQIELMACAYAALNAAIYFFWWHKPFRVDCPIMLRSEIPPAVQEVYTFTTDFTNKLGQLLGLDVYNGSNFRGRLQMPTFDSGCLLRTEISQNIRNVVAEVLIAAVFGGIHLFAWNYQFPTGVELWLWRVSALMIVGIPPFFWISLAILNRLECENALSIPDLIVDIYLLTVPLSYIISRLFILILSLISLRKLPVGTLSNVDWLTFIPHID